MKNATLGAAMFAMIGSAALGSAACAQQQEAPPASLLSRFRLTEQARSWQLPSRYREVSGLALTPDGRLFAHNDELAIIFQINYQNGEMVKAFAMGNRTVTGDFEGITIVDGRFYLVTSDGWIYESAEGEDGERLLYNSYGTGVGRACEVEGLTFDAAQRHLILVCKTPRVRALNNTVTMFRWSIDERRMAADSMLSIPLRRFTSRIDDDDFNPSGIAHDAATGRMLIIAARQAAIAEITPTGTVVAVHEFRRRDHRQVEGIEVTKDGHLLLADEGRNRRARLTVYPPSRNP